MVFQKLFRENLKPGFATQTNIDQFDLSSQGNVVTCGYMHLQEYLLFAATVLQTTKWSRTVRFLVTPAQV